MNHDDALVSTSLYGDIQQLITTLEERLTKISKDSNEGTPDYSEVFSRQNLQEIESLNTRTNMLSGLLIRVGECVRHEAEAIQTHTLRIHNSFRPAVNLPTEILANIFTLACFFLPRGTGSRPFDEVARSVAATRTLVGLTCHRWREIAESTKALWCMVSLRSAPTSRSRRSPNNVTDKPDVIRASGFPDRLSHVRMWVALTNDTPLQQDTIRFLSTTLPKAERIFYQSVFREPSLEDNPLFCDPPVTFPWLRRLVVECRSITEATLNLSHAPRLQELEYFPKSTNGRLQLGANCQLRRLTLKGCVDPNHVSEILTSCPLVETLYLSVNIPPHTPTNTLVFPHLRHLVLQDLGRERASSIPLRLIEAPKLESLGLTFEGQDFDGPLVHASSLRYLSLGITEYPEHRLHYLRSLLESCSSVRRLEWGDYNNTESARIWLQELLLSPDILPNLEYLETDAYVDLESELLDGHPAILDLRPSIMLILPNGARSRQYIKKFSAYASRIKISEEKDFPEIVKYMSGWDRSEEGWCD